MTHVLRLLTLCLLLLSTPAWAVSFTESWTGCADNASLNCTVNWTEYGGANIWSIVSNQAKYNSSGADDESFYGDTAMATQNHFVQVTLPSLTHEVTKTEGVGPTCRKTADAVLTFYVWRMVRSDSLNQHELVQTIAGVDTVLGTDATDFSAGEVLYLSCVGSQITARINGTLASFGVITDTGITGNLRVGVFGYFNGVLTSTIVVDDFSAGDIGGAQRRRVQ